MKYPGLFFPRYLLFLQQRQWWSQVSWTQLPGDYVENIDADQTLLVVIRIAAAHSMRLLTIRPLDLPMVVRRRIQPILWWHRQPLRRVADWRYFAVGKLSYRSRNIFHSTPKW